MRVRAHVCDMAGRRACSQQPNLPARAHVDVDVFNAYFVSTCVFLLRASRREVHGTRSQLMPF